MREIKMGEHLKLPKGSRKLAHGTECYCGTCGEWGVWDDLQHGNGEVLTQFEDAVWYNPNIPADEDGPMGGIECYECWLK